MLRFLASNLLKKRPLISPGPILQHRYMCNKTEMIIGGGLEKPQGGMKEEKYFYKQNNDLMAKIREQGTKFKYENHITDWNHFEKVLGARDDRTALRETCSLNKHKNCMEEAFFLNEQNDCYTKLCREYDLDDDDEIDWRMSRKSQQ